MNRKYIVRMSAGLANRMFQYSYALYLQKLGYEVFVDNNYKATKWKMENIDWNRIFPNAPINQASTSLIFKYGGGYSFIDKIRRHYLSFTSRVWIMNNATDVPSDFDLRKFRYLIGVMQDACVVDSVKNEVQDLFRYSVFKKDTNNYRLSHKMMSENSVSVHLRKGLDYMKNEKFQNTCTLEYYQKAINIIKARVSNPVFYVFTDNPNWVKDNLKGFDYILVEGNPTIGWGNHFDMQLMSCCKHNIIANSTYSWWGAFLNPNPDKIVIDPKYWYNPSIPEFRDRPNKTACEGWILI